jgi:hypothetical protein
MSTTNLAALVRKVKYYEEGPAWVRNMWPTSESFAWFIKNNQETLQERGAIAKLARDWLIDSESFEPVIRSMLKRPPI